LSFTLRVLGGTSIITVAGVCAKLLSVFALPVLTVLLGAENFGLAALAVSIVSLGVVFGILGLDMAYPRFYLQEDESNREKVENFCWRLVIIASISASVVLIVIWQIFQGQVVAKQHWYIGVYASIAIVLTAIVTMATTKVRLIGDYKKLSISILLSAALTILVSILVAKYWRADVMAILIGNVIGLVVSLLILGLPNASKIWGKSKLEKKLRLSVLKLGVAGSITAPMYWVITSADRWFLAGHSTAATIGIYSVAANVAFLGMILNNAITLTWFPEVSRLYGEKGAQSLDQIGRLWERLVVGLGIVWLLVTATGGDVLQILTAKEFHSGAEYIYWLAGGVFFYGLAGLSNTAFFLSGKMNWVAISWGIGAVVSITLNILIIPNHGAYGAAAVQTMTFLLIATLIYTKSRAVLSLPVNWIKLSTCLLLTLATGLMMNQSWAEVPQISLALKSFPTLVVIWLLLYLIAPDWLNQGLQRIKSK
jgi:O-antigen/teichoic acid export membrane protein